MSLRAGELRLPLRARAAYQRVIDSGHAEWAPRAAVNLGVLLAGQVHAADFRILFSPIIVSKMMYTRAEVQRLLEQEVREQQKALHQQRKDVAGARTTYQQAIDSGHPKWAPKAVIYLRRLE